MIGLNLTDEEKNKMGEMMREHKFPMEKDFLYSSNIDKINNFIRCYRYLDNLSNTEIIEEPIRNKIKNFLLQFEEGMKKIDFLMGKRNVIMKHRLSKEIISFVNNNSEKINFLLDVVYPLGRVTSLYNPDESVGVY